MYNKDKKMYNLCSGNESVKLFEEINEMAILCEVFFK